MAAKKVTENEIEGGIVVLVPFAYARAKSGEVVQLVKGDRVDPSRFDPDSLSHLESIGFIGASKK